MKTIQQDKAERILSIYSRLEAGKLIKKKEEADQFGVSARTIQRDISDIQNFLQEQNNKTGEIREILFDKSQNGYKLKSKNDPILHPKEILAAAKILLESRALIKQEIFPIINKMINLCDDKNERRKLSLLLQNEMYHYIELHHGKSLLDLIWILEDAVKSQKYVQIRYRKVKNKEIVERTVKPVGVMFSDFYFYLTAYIEGFNKAERFQNPDDVYPTIYRLDRIENVQVSDKHFTVPYAKRFEEGEFRRRIQFMYGGKLQKVKFKFYGEDEEFILDRIPTAEVVFRGKDYIVISAEVFGSGIEMWLKSQGDKVEKISER